MFIFKDNQEIFPYPVEGVIEQCGANRLRVKALGSTWNAKLDARCPNARLICGQMVDVIGRVGIRLIITTPNCEI